jgi:hypothetical protein
MANNYLEFSTAIKDLTEEERKWCEDELEKLEEEHDKSLEDFGDGVMHFEYSFERGDTMLWFHVCESGDPMNVADFISSFLERWRPDQCHSFAWAEYCSKPRLDEFGGGAAFITAKEIKTVGTWSWMEEQEIAFMENKKESTK